MPIWYTSRAPIRRTRGPSLSGPASGVREPSVSDNLPTFLAPAKLNNVDKELAAGRPGRCRKPQKGRPPKPAPCSRSVGLSKFRHLARLSAILMTVQHKERNLCA